jgi:DinB superfamily
MGPKDVITQTLDASDHILKRYLADLSDADLRLQPVEGMNSIALQLGHLITAERKFVEMVKPGASPPLPAGFAEKHDLKNATKDDSRFASKDEYIKLWDAQRAATKAVLATTSDASLDDTQGGKLPPFAPTVGAVFNMAGAHALGHTGQFVAVRRFLKKPIAF